MAKIRNLNGAIQIEMTGGNPVDDGTEYERVGPRAHFNSQREMLDAMARPEYKRSESYRQVVKQIVAQSDPVALGLAADRSQDGAAEYHLGKMQTVREMFADPRYKTDARYRDEVARICASPAADEAFPEYSRDHIESRGVAHRISLGDGQETGPIDPNASTDGDE